MWGEQEHGSLSSGRVLGRRLEEAGLLGRSRLGLTHLSVPGAMPAGGRELLVLGLLALGCAAANDFPEGVVGRRRPPGPAHGCPRDCGCTQEGVVDCGGIDLKEFPLLLPELTNHLSLQVNACVTHPGSILPPWCVLEAVGPMLVLHSVPLAHLWVSHHLRISHPHPAIPVPEQRGNFVLILSPHIKGGKKKVGFHFSLFSPQVQKRNFCPK